MGTIRHRFVTQIPLEEAVQRYCVTLEEEVRHGDVMVKIDGVPVLRIGTFGGFHQKPRMIPQVKRSPDDLPTGMEYEQVNSPMGHWRVKVGGAER